MTADNCVAEFLGQLEREEMSVLAWDLHTAFFQKSSLKKERNSFWLEVKRPASRPHSALPGVSVQALLDRQLVWKLPETQRYRTRMAETLRFFARLRQIFPDRLNAAWRKAPNLVADYRLIVRPRLYPIRASCPLHCWRN